jgi:hypothetical protein
MSQALTKVPSTPDLEYTAAIAMLTAESQVFWALTQAFLLAETILAGFLLQADPAKSDPFLRGVGAVLGIVVGILWISATIRIRAYVDLRTARAKKLEGEDPDGIFTSGANISIGFSTKKSALGLAFGFIVFFIIVAIVQALGQ